jgi:hypothetical protein
MIIKKIQKPRTKVLWFPKSKKYEPEVISKINEPQ